jgi:hypothetical protein
MIHEHTCGGGLESGAPSLFVVAFVSDSEEAYARACAGKKKKQQQLRPLRIDGILDDRRDATRRREGREEGGELGSLRGPPSPSSALARIVAIATYAMPAQGMLFLPLPLLV